MKRFTLSVLSILFVSLFLKAGCSSSDEDLEQPLPNADQYITWNFGSHKGQLTVPTDSITVDNFYGPTDVFATTRMGNNYVYASINGTAAGTFPLQLYIFTGGKYFNSQPSTTVSISSFGAPGGYIVGSYSGKMKDSSSTNMYDVNGAFRVKRQ